MDRKIRLLLTLFAFSPLILPAADPKPDRAAQAAVQVAGAGNSARTIRLKSEEFLPAGDAEANLDRVKAKYANRPVVHVILQFEQLPTEAQRKELRARGVKLMGYLPDHAYFASVPARVKAADLKPFRVRWAGAIYKEDKSAPRIRAEGFGGWALRPGGTAVSVRSEGVRPRKRRERAGYGVQSFQPCGAVDSSMRHLPPQYVVQAIAHAWAGAACRIERH